MEEDDSDSTAGETVVAVVDAECAMSLIKVSIAGVPNCRRNSASRCVRRKLFSNSARLSANSCWAWTSAVFCCACSASAFCCAACCASFRFFFPSRPRCFLLLGGIVLCFLLYALVRLFYYWRRVLVVVCRVVTSLLWLWVFI